MGREIRRHTVHISSGRYKKIVIRIMKLLAIFFPYLQCCITRIRWADHLQRMNKKWLKEYCWTNWVKVKSKDKVWRKTLGVRGWRRIVEDEKRTGACCERSAKDGHLCVIHLYQITCQNMETVSSTVRN